MTVSDIYDTFFINNEKEFRYIGCKSKETFCNLENAITRAVEMITIKNNGKYELINDIELPLLEDQVRIQWFVNNAVMKYFVEGSTCGAKWENCGWGWVTTYQIWYYRLPTLYRANQQSKCW